MELHTIDMFNIIKKADIFLIVILILCGLGATWILSAGHHQAEKVVITIRGKTFGTYPLSEDRIIDTHTGNIISIKDGAVYMKSATCRNQDCVRQGKIHESSQSIICLPHKLVVEIKGGNGHHAFDTISK